jgi:predicted phosphodiesterase
MTTKQTLLDSPPVLQNPTPHSVTVTWAVNGPATGWVEYGETSALGKRADAAIFGQHVYSSKFLRISLTGLEPGKAIFYRVVVAPIVYPNGSQVERGEAEFGPIYSWTPLDATAEAASFSVINDTHEREETLAKLMMQLADNPTDLTVWNGDIFNFVENEEQIAAQVLRPAGAAYAAEHPVLFTSGNHDFRGQSARALSQAVSPWQDESPLGRCFAVRQGPLAIIGLDTAEDKPDRHPFWAGLAAYEPYREAQRDWLKAALQRPEISNAPFLIAFCHIPLWGLPGHNPGDTLEGFAYYCRHAQQLWHPVLEEAGVQLVISGHMHHYRYDEPTAEHSYGQIVGGGPDLEQATLIRGYANNSLLEVVAKDLNQKELGRWEFSPREK